VRRWQSTEASCRSCPAICFVTDGGIETTLIFHEGLELPFFAAFDLFKHATGESALVKYFRTYAALANQYVAGCILESATWRASTDWGAKLGYSTAALVETNRRAIAILHQVRQEFESSGKPMVISGCIGPRGDGYNPASFMTETEAENYHALQAETFGAADADMVTAMTMTYPAEAIGIGPFGTAGRDASGYFIYRRDRWEIA
jgi:S-methylmethionine-dependent homocysteine/selenocysteine methylase